MDVFDVYSADSPAAIQSRSFVCAQVCSLFCRYTPLRTDEEQKAGSDDEFEFEYKQHGVNTQSSAL